jgi:type I restriction enzyme S subunit
MSTKWPKVRLGEVLKPIWREEKVNPSAEYRLLGVRWYGGGLFIKETCLGQHIRSDRLYQVQEGDFVYNRLFGWKGSFAVVGPESNGCYVSNEFPCFVVDQNRLNTNFLWWYCRREIFWNEVLNLSTGATPTSRNRLKERIFLNLEIPLPPLTEQRRIVGKIDHLAAKIAEGRSLHHQTIGEAEVLFEQGRAQVFETASKQAAAPLGNLATLERGKFSHRPRNAPRFFGGKHPWIQIGEIERSNKFIREWNATLNDEGLSISKKFPKGTVLVSIAATIGAVGILAFDCCVPDSIVGVTPREGTDSEFLYHFFGYVRTHLENIAPQSAQKNVNLQILSHLPVPKLELQEQRRTVAYLDSFQANVGALQRLQADNATKLDALLPSILAKAFQGEL